MNLAKALTPVMMSFEEEKKMKMAKEILNGKFFHFEIRNFKSWSILLMPSCIKYATFKIVRNVQKSKW